MKGVNDKKVKLLVSIIGQRHVEKLSDVINRSGVALNFSGVGHGTARSSYRSYFGLFEKEKRVVYSLINAAFKKQILESVEKELKLYLPGNGIAFSVPLTGISNIVEDAVLSSDKGNSSQQKNRKERSTMHELVIAVVNEKYTDAVVDAARSAGATGATVFNTRSINNKKAEQVIGANLPEETNSVFFLTSREYKLRIMEAVRDVAGLKTEGGAVIFSLPVEDIVGIGRFDESEDAES